MRVDGTYAFDVAPERVWARLLDPEALAACIPGCRELTRVTADEYRVTMSVGIGAIRGAYEGKVTVTDRDEPRSFRMTVEGKGRGGSIKGDAVLTLRGVDGGTEIVLAGEAHVTGVVARVGQRLLGSASTMITGQFFECMGKLEQ